MEQKELKTVSDYQVAFADLALDCKEKFGAEKLEVHVYGDEVEITFK
jgi:hypothetical protein